MGQIVIKCPVTGRLVPTGMGADKSSFEASSYEGNSFQCPECGNMHTWDKKDAQLQDD